MPPHAAMLEALASADGVLNKYQLQKRTKLARQTVYDWVPRMEKLGWIKVARTEKSRVGLPVKYYELTDRGWFRAAVLAPSLSAKIRERLGSKYAEYEERQKVFYERQLEPWFQMIREILRSGRIPNPRWRLSLDIRAKKQGGVRCRVRAGVPVRRPRRAQVGDGPSS
jgi:DNA-binding PadR family transcriptional regulator